MSSHLGNSRRQMVELLAQQIRGLERAQQANFGGAISSGCHEFDRWLPEQGFRRGTLVEWLAAGEGSGAGVLALVAARAACQDGGALVVVDRQQEFYPPAAAALGIDVAGLVIVRPRNQRDDWWAIEQALRSRGVGAVWCRCDHVAASREDSRLFRRFQLAAERGGALGLVVRPAATRRLPSWADMRLWVEPLAAREGRCLRVELLHSRHAATAGTLAAARPASVELIVDDETGAVRVAPRLALAAISQRAARA